MVAQLGVDLRNPASYEGEKLPESVPDELRPFYEAGGEL